MSRAVENSKTCVGVSRSFSSFTLSDVLLTISGPDACFLTLIYAP